MRKLHAVAALFIAGIFVSMPARAQEAHSYRCDPPRGKRVDYGDILKLDGTPLQRLQDGPQWTEDGFSGVRPIVVIKPHEIIVTWGDATPKELSGIVHRRTYLYDIPILRRDASSVFGMRTHRATVDLFRFYFNVNLLYLVTSSQDFAGMTSRPVAMAAIYVARCHPM